ncbi:MAG: DHH family phosphoesterase [Desulfosudaceae bacterium]
MYQEVAARLQASREVLLASHIHPDGDAIGSLVALGLGLKNHGKKVTLYNEHPVPPAYQFLSGSDLVVNEIPDLSHYDLIVVLDCSKIERLGKIAERISSLTTNPSSDLTPHPTLINIDHHCSNEYFGGFQLVECQASATTEILYRLIKVLGCPVTKEIAYGIYTGIVTDTASFSFSNTTPVSLKICGEMMEAGVDPSHVYHNVYITYSPERIRFMQMVLDTFVVSKGNKVSFMMATREMIHKSGMKPENVGRIVNYAKHIENVMVSALALQEDDNTGCQPDEPANFHVSLRSDGAIDVSKIAVKFGGGGHHRAAGFNITATFQKVRETILGLAENI